MKLIQVILHCMCCSLVFLGSCDSNAVSPTGTTTGTAGSLSRFIIVNQYLYTVDNQTLRIFDIRTDSAILKTNLTVGSGIETIFSRGNTLFLGANSGVHIFDITDREAPIFLSKYEHIISCDPVVADAKYAYSTLRTSSGVCNRGSNVLDIIDITNLERPVRIFSLPMVSPKGLGLIGDHSLVVCDEGLKLIDITNRSKPVLLHTYRSGSMLDIIPSTNSFTALSISGMSNFTVANDSLHLIGKLEYR